MRNLLAVLALTLLAAPAAADLGSEFKARARPELIKPFALDLGGILGAASAHHGRSLGFPGVWAGAVGAVQLRPDRDNRILRDSGVKEFGLPLVEVQVGLPARLDLIAHGLKAHGMTVLGGGLRWGALRPMKGVSLAVPSLSLSAIGDVVDHRYFAAQHLGLNAAASWDLPVVKPLLVAGADVTSVRVRAADTAGVANKSEVARGTRLAAGVELKPFPFVSLRALYALRHGIPGFDLGLGVSF